MKHAERRPDRVSLRQLRLVAALGEQASILRAARSLGMSQPAATKLLADLEHDSGGPLFTRTNRGVLPNTRGMAMIRHARLVLSQVGSAFQELADLDDGTGGSVAVGSLLTASSTLLPRAIAELRRTRPNVSVLVTEGGTDTLFPALQRGELDLVVGRLPEFVVHPNVLHHALYRERISVLVRRGHPLLGRRKLKLAELANAAWILPPPETTVRRRLETLFQNAGLEPPRPAVQSISLAISRRLLLETDMLGVLPDLVVDDEMRAGLILALPLELPSASVGVSRRRDALLPPAAQALIEAVQVAARRMQT